MFKTISKIWNKFTNKKNRQTQALNDWDRFVDACVQDMGVEDKTDKADKTLVKQLISIFSLIGKRDYEMNRPHQAKYVVDGETVSPRVVLRMSDQECSKILVEIQEKDEARNMTWYQDAEPSELYTNRADYSRKVDGKYKAPHIIGLWQEKYYDEWLGDLPPERTDSEEDYFKSTFQSLQSYVDDYWTEEERKTVFRYLMRHQVKVDRLIAQTSSAPQFGHVMTHPNEEVETDGHYMWHESLPQFVRYYNVRPPKFFVDYILTRTDQPRQSNGEPK